MRFLRLHPTKAILLGSVTLAVAVIGTISLLRAVDNYGDRKYRQRCVGHHADYCNFDGDGDSGKPWWAKGRSCELQKGAEEPYYYEACVRQAQD